MKAISLILFLIIQQTLPAQSRILDTLYANESQVVSLFFPRPIRQGITGKDQFVFSFNEQEENYFGLLQAQKGEDSNLLVLTNDGMVYSYRLKYKKDLKTLNHFISEKASLGNEVFGKRTESLDAATKVSKPLAETPDFDKYQSNCRSFLSNSRRTLNQSRKKYGIRLSMKDRAFRDGAFYYLMELDNGSSIPYNLKYLKFFNRDKSGLFSKSQQTMEISSIYRYKFPELVPAHSKQEFVIVLPKFSLNREKKIYVELNETNGERDLVFDLTKMKSIKKEFLQFNP